MKTRNFPVIESYPLTIALKADNRRKVNAQFPGFIKACIDANFNSGDYKAELKIRLSNIEVMAGIKKKVIYFEYGFGGSHAWIKQIGNSERLILVEIK